MSIFSKIFNETDKMFGFWTISPCLSLVVKNMHFWAQCSMQFKVSWFFLVSASRSKVVKNVNFESTIFNLTENFWILNNFHLRQSLVVKKKKSQLWTKSSTLQNFLILLNFSIQVGLDWSKMLILRKVYTQLKIFGFWTISSAAALIALLGQLSAWLKNFLILPNLVICRFRALVKMSILRQIFNTTQSI